MSGVILASIQHKDDAKYRALSVAILLLLSACNNSADSDGDGEVSRDERAGRIPAEISLPLKPGLWQSDVIFTQIKVPGLSNKKQQEIMARMSKAASKKSCLTADNAPHPAADFFGSGVKGACKYRSFGLKSDTAEMALSCEMDGMAIADMDMRGTIQAARYDMNVTTELRLPMAGKVKLTGTSQGTYLGSCNG